MADERMSPGARRQLGALVRHERDKRRWSSEEVAERAGIGASWYGWLEAGRTIALSHVVLEWLAAALELTPALRTRLFALAEPDARPRLSRVRAELVPPGVREMLSAVSRFPAYVTGRRGDVIAWNEPTEALYRCSSIPPMRRNTLVFLFDQPDVRRLVVNWDDQARRVLRAYRERLRQDPDDEWLGEVRTVLENSSAELRVLWDLDDDDEPDDKTFVKVFQKRGVGRLTFRVEELVPEGAPDLLVSVYVPDPGDKTGARLDTLLRNHRRGGSALRERERRHHLARQIKEHLDETYMNEMSADELASLFGIDRFRLSRIFADDVGFPPHAYRLLVRVERAKRLLLKGDAAVDVAAAVGFVDQSHLIRHFRRIEGLTPGAFVKRARRAVGRST